jgi:hypothetical protein
MQLLLRVHNVSGLSRKTPLKETTGVCDVCSNSQKKIKEKKPKTVVSTSSYITKSSRFDTLK